jgi:hypothetical protein
MRRGRSRKTVSSAPSGLGYFLNVLPTAYAVGYILYAAPAATY